MTGQKSDFRLCAAGKLNKMDCNILHDRLIPHYIDYFQICIVDFMPVCSNNEYQLDERKWIWSRFHNSA